MWYIKSKTAHITITLFQLKNFFNWYFQFIHNGWKKWVRPMSDKSVFARFLFQHKIEAPLLAGVSVSC